MIGDVPYLVKWLDVTVGGGVNLSVNLFCMRRTQVSVTTAGALKSFSHYYSEVCAPQCWTVQNIQLEQLAN